MEINLKEFAEVVSIVAGTDIDLAGAAVLISMMATMIVALSRSKT